MRLYAESSAVLAAVLGETAGEQARGRLARAELVLTSELTLIECGRALHRAAALKKLVEGEAAQRRALIAAAGCTGAVLKIFFRGGVRSRATLPSVPMSCV